MAEKDERERKKGNRPPCVKERERGEENEDREREKRISHA